MRFLDEGSCVYVKPAIAEFVMAHPGLRAVFTVREERYVARHALILYGPADEPVLATSETAYFTSGYSGAGTRTLLTTVYLLLGLDVKVGYVALDGEGPFPPYDDAAKNDRFYRTLAKEAKPLILSIATLGEDVDEESAYCAFNFERGSLMVKR